MNYVLPKLRGSLKLGLNYLSQKQNIIKKESLKDALAKFY